MTDKLAVTDDSGGDDWIKHLIGFAAQCENEGLFGLAKATVDQTTSLTFQLASAVTSTACHIVSEATHALIHHQPDESSYVLPLHYTHHHHYQDEKREQKEKDEQQNNEAPFLLKLAFQVSDIMLATISPVLSNNNGRGYVEYRGDTIRLIEDDADDMISTRSISSFCSLNNNDDFFHDAYSCDWDNDNNSVYFDANATASTCSESDSTNEDDTNESIDKSSSFDSDESQSCIIESLPDSMLAADAAAESSQTFFLDISGPLLSKLDDIGIPLMKDDNNTVCFKLGNQNSETSVRPVLDGLICHSLELISSENSLDWQPDDTTKKTLQRYEQASYDNNQWVQTLENEVLKWTTQVDNTPMLRTQGIINMTPTQINDLLLDCSRVKEYNKCSLEKRDLCTLPSSSSCSGEARIVEHIMQIPLVGGKVETLSLTHSRPLQSFNDGSVEDDEGFVIVSRSVKKELNGTVDNPCFSVSKLRSIAGTDKTELTTLTSISSLPIPQFLMHRVAFYGADDFFGNLRKMCS